MKSLKKFGIGTLYGLFAISFILQIHTIVSAIINFSNTPWYKLPSAVIYIWVYSYIFNTFKNRNTPTDRWSLKYKIDKEIKRYGLNCDLNHINVSKIKDFSDLFNNSEFNGNISKWDTSNAINMNSMFWSSKFKGDISNWDTSKVISMSFMFYEAEFNGNISKWDVSSVKTMAHMFSSAKFDGDISNWNVKNVLNMDFMFYKSDFNGDLNNWKVINLYGIEHIFYDSKFNWPNYGDDEEDKSLLPLPYWANYPNKEERDNAINQYFNNK